MVVREVCKTSFCATRQVRNSAVFFFSSVSAEPQLHQTRGNDSRRVHNEVFRVFDLNHTRTLSPRKKKEHPLPKKRQFCVFGMQKEENVRRRAPSGFAYTS